MKADKSILLIDDEEELLKMLSRTLELEGYQVATANDGEKGLALMEEYRPDLILLDVWMPGLDGIEVLDLIRQCSDVPVIILTAMYGVLNIPDALELGADDYVKKPFDMRELLARVQANLRRVHFQPQHTRNASVFASC